jgi:mRNA deadenylase 3'-5' endonuclease subunit Ccr4
MSNEKNVHHLKVLSYNMLADAYCNNYMFPYAYRGALIFNYRSKRILDEIEVSNSDIICL